MVAGGEREKDMSPLPLKPTPPTQARPVVARRAQPLALDLAAAVRQVRRAHSTVSLLHCGIVRCEEPARRDSPAHRDAYPRRSAARGRAVHSPADQCADRVANCPDCDDRASGAGATLTRDRSWAVADHRHYLPQLGPDMAPSDVSGHGVAVSPRARCRHPPASPSYFAGQNRNAHIPSQSTLRGCKSCRATTPTECLLVIAAGVVAGGPARQSGPSRHFALPLKEWMPANTRRSRSPGRVARSLR